MLLIRTLSGGNGSFFEVESMKAVGLTVFSASVMLRRF